MPGILAFQEYVPTNWVDGTAPAINAANLNHIEQGIKNAQDDAINLDGRVLNLEQNPYELPGATPNALGGVRVEVVDNGDGTFTGKIWTSNP